MKLAYIRWKDALADEADGPFDGPQLAILNEVGFLVGENDEAITIVMELQEGDVHPGRWRLTIPKAQVLEFRVVDFKKAFAAPRVRKPKVVAKGEGAMIERIEADTGVGSIS